MHTKFMGIVVSMPWLLQPLGGPWPNAVSILTSWTCMTLFFFAILNGIGIKSKYEALNLISSNWKYAALISGMFALLQYIGFARYFEWIISNAAIGEAYANLRQRNQFATLSNVGVAVFLICSSCITKHHENNKILSRSYLEWNSYVCVALLAASNAASSSRTGLVQLIILACIVVYINTNNKSLTNAESSKLLMVCIFSYLIASISLPNIIGLNTFGGGIFGRFKEMGDACQSRLVLWSNVMQLIAQKPLLGWGWGELDYAHFITLYPGNRFCDILDNAHNLPLHLAVELGVPVSAAFCALCIWLIKREKPWREQDPMRQLAWTVLALIGLHSMLEYPLWYGPFQMTVLLCFYILWRTPASWRGGTSQVKPLLAVLSQIASALAVVVMVACAYAAWDYWRISQIYTAPTQRDPAYQDDTLNKIKGSWLFQSQVRFAELNITPLTKDNAEHINALAKEMLHFSPEPQVVKKLIESAVMLGDDAEAAYYLQRFKAAFPDAKL